MIKIYCHMEKEIFSTEVQIRKIGERRYGKGKIKITDKNIYINFKKLLSRPQTLTIPREKIEKVEFKTNELPIKIVGPGYPFGSEQTWVTMDIVLKDGGGFTIYVGELWRMSKETREKYLEKYMKIKEILES